MAEFNLEKIARDAVDNILYNYELYGQPIIMWIHETRQNMPRVLSIGDLYGEDMGYYEERDNPFMKPVLITNGGPDDSGFVNLVTKSGTVIKADCEVMNVAWRIWNRFPKSEQRDSTKWSDTSEGSDD